ncbi:MAG: hypothetical protein FWG05_04320, partial [Kiritimatiellaeota bacterium]|nr:hypothetical protein [Kiritimatiellota bacterium]
VMIMGRDTPAAVRARLAEFAALFIESENRARPPFFSSEPGLKWAETSGEDSKRFAVAIDSLINDHNKSNDEYLIREYGDEFDEISQSALDDLTRFAKIVFAEEYAQSQTGKRK